MDYNHISHKWLITDWKLVGGKKQMKKKVITALLITMTLTLGGVGTAYAMNNDMSILSGEAVNDVNMIKEGFIWVVDKESWTETIHHEEEGHYENGKLLEKEQGHYEEVVVKPAWEEEKYVVDKEAWTETINHPEEFHYETVVIKPAWDEEVTIYKDVCYNCGFEITSNEAWIQHFKANKENGCVQHGDREFTDIIHHEAVTEQKKVVDKAAWTETINHPEEGHTEIIKHPAVIDDVWVIDKPAVYEQVWVVDKEAWTETITHPEEGHWEPVKDEEKPEKPEQKPDEEKPETPEQKPDEEKPENPEQKPDEEKPETPEQKPDEETPENSENSNTDNKQDSTEDTSKDKTDNKNDNKTDSKKEETKTAPKTGDPTNLAYLATLAGSALVGGVSWKFRKRK